MDANRDTSRVRGGDEKIDPTREDDSSVPIRDGNHAAEAARVDGGKEFVDEEGANPEYERTDPGDNPWDETVIALLFVVGVILVLVPDPVTSAMGGLLIGLGVLAWAIDLIR